MTRKFSEIEPRHSGFYALVRAVEICRTRRELARRVGVDPMSVWHWLNRDAAIPVQHIARICAAVNDPDVTPWTLRPDFIEDWKLLARLLRPLLPDDAAPIDTQASTEAA
jgi:DNA-binding transcriptional regulator YdaS (Cro superfamily)